MRAATDMLRQLLEKEHATVILAVLRQTPSLFTLLRFLATVFVSTYHIEYKLVKAAQPSSNSAEVLIRPTANLGCV